MQTAVLEAKASTFSALRSRDFRIFWASSTAMNLGEWMQLFGLGYLVVQLAVRAGAAHLVPLYARLLGLSQAIPGLTFGLLGGVCRRPLRAAVVIIAAQSFLCAFSALLALLTISRQINIAEVLVINGLISSVKAFNDPAWASWIPDLVPCRYLVSAIGLNTVSYNSAQILGPMAGGLLYVPLGIGGLFVLNAVGYLVVVAAVILIHSRPSTEISEPTAEPARSRPLQSITGGMRYIRHDSVMLWVFVLCAASQFLVRPYTQLLPSFAEGTLHVAAVRLSWLMTASGVGALTGALVIASLSSLQRRGRLLVLAGIALGLALALLATQRVLPLAIGSVAILGFLVTLFQGTANTAIQLRTPTQLRGRVLSVLLTIPLAIMPLGVGTVGFVGSATGIAMAMTGAGLLFATIALIGRMRARELWGWVDRSSIDTDADSRVLTSRRTLPSPPRVWVDHVQGR